MGSVEFPVFGPTVANLSQWGSELFALHQFSHLADYAGERSRDEPPCPVEWLNDWQTHMVDLSKIVRDFSVRPFLHERRLFEVYITLPAGDRVLTPTSAQTNAFRNFVTSEDRISQRVTNALFRYYQTAHDDAPDHFEDEAGVANSVAELHGKVEFDSLRVSRVEVDAQCPLEFCWSPAWDAEHGLTALMFDNEVILVGQDDIVDDATNGQFDLSWIWKRSIMTPAEVTALARFQQAVQK